jgi:hypothetical protein
MTNFLFARGAQKNKPLHRNEPCLNCLCVFIEQFPSGVCTISSKTPHLVPPTLSAPLNAHLSSLPLITFHLRRRPEHSYSRFI